jgi:hypothetical protein
VLHEQRTTPYHWLGNRIINRIHIRHPRTVSGASCRAVNSSCPAAPAPTQSLGVSERQCAPSASDQGVARHCSPASVTAEGSGRSLSGETDADCSVSVQ